MTSNKAITKYVAETTGIAACDIKTVLTVTVHYMVEQLRQNAKVNLFGLGTFSIRHRKARTIVHTGKSKIMGARTVVQPATRFTKFSSAKNLKRKLNKHSKTSTP